MILNGDAGVGLIKSSWFHKTASHKGAKPLLSLDLHEWREEEEERAIQFWGRKWKRGHVEDKTVPIG